VPLKNIYIRKISQRINIEHSWRYLPLKLFRREVRGRKWVRGYKNGICPGI